MKSRKPVEFSENFNKALLGYAAAGAAGMGMFATVPAKADIIYTPAHTTIKPNTSLALNLNHDGITDFQLTNFYEHHCVGGEVPCTSFFTIEAMAVQGGKSRQWGPQYYVRL